jgi:hypothetical protein
VLRWWPHPARVADPIASNYPQGSDSIASNADTDLEDQDHTDTDPKDRDHMDTNLTDQHHPDTDSNKLNLIDTDLQVLCAA